MRASGVGHGAAPVTWNPRMHRNKSLSVVIPCKNEEQGIATVLAGVPSYVDEVLVVDSSTDRTPEIAAQMGARVVREDRLGYGRAYKTGLAEASGDVIATIDGDLTYPIEQLDRLVDYLLDNDLDFVNASRFPLKDRGSMRTLNVVGNKLITLVFNILYFKSLADALSGMWVIRAEAVPKLRVRSDNWNFSEEIKIEAIVRDGVRFGECRIPYRERVGDSKLSPFKVGFENVMFLFAKRFTIGRGEPLRRAKAGLESK
jgi:glycosyltransferase involved in cell wall biosynthesis